MSLSKVCESCSSFLEDEPKYCSECEQMICDRCSGKTCGICSDPSELKMYYCKKHEEPVCVECDELICHYCGTRSVWCEKCDAGPFHAFASGYIGGDLCMRKHTCQKDEFVCGTDPDWGFKEDEKPHALVYAEVPPIRDYYMKSLVLPEKKE